MIDKNKPIDADVSQAASDPEEAEAAAEENAGTDLAPEKNTPLDTTIEQQLKTGLTRDKNTPID